ncbi:hypothetical protein BDK51DRAFT_33060, partial [Blyttiomyces helicus]
MAIIFSIQSLRAPHKHSTRFRLCMAGQLGEYLAEKALTPLFFTNPHVSPELRPRLRTAPTRLAIAYLERLDRAGGALPDRTLLNDVGALLKLYRHTPEEDHQRRTLETLIARYSVEIKRLAELGSVENPIVIDEEEEARRGAAETAAGPGGVPGMSAGPGSVQSAPGIPPARSPRTAAASASASASAATTPEPPLPPPQLPPAPAAAESYPSPSSLSPTGAVPAQEIYVRWGSPRLCPAAKFKAQWRYEVVDALTGR